MYTRDNPLSHNCDTNTFTNANTKHRRKQANSVVQVQTILLTSDFGSSTRGERHNSNKADHTVWPHKRAAHPVMFKTSVGRDPKNTTASSMIIIQLSTSNSTAGTQLSACIVQCQSWTDSFLKSSNSPDHLFRAWRHPHSSLISCLEFIMTMVMVISFVHEHKTVPNGKHLNS